MSAANLNNNGKAVVKKETTLPTGMEGVPAQTQTTSHGFKELMHHCVAALDSGNIMAVNADLRAMSSLVSIDGHPSQRVAFAFAEALARRALHQALPGLSWGLQLQFAQQPTPAYTAAARRCFGKLCPFLRIAASAVNNTIVTAMEAEQDVHVVDLGWTSPNQWADLLRLFAMRPQGPPVLRLTIISDREEFLSYSAGLLTQAAMRWHVPFVFNPVRSHIDRLTARDIAAFGVHAGQALVIISTLQLHRLIADEITIELPATGASHVVGLMGPGSHKITKADALLRVLCDLKPKLMVMTEQDSDHNCTNLWERVSNAFDYYSAIFSDLEVGGGAPRGLADRAAVERLLLREEIMDIVARDGSSRRERHESVKRWVERMGKAGFKPVPVISDIPFVEGTVPPLHVGDDGTVRYWIANKGMHIVINSRRTPIYSVTAWRPARKN
ncbi:hypothetical protein HU200_008339 [Digitaria exilis]|uniref:GRAS family transcription factor n=1 Tax=Digitaria exilis TaxID=1010633 RepID=A0A835KQF2_9POAL|nr:hypothetical protein HU200_008339 [Digitaria exilis]